MEEGDVWFYVVIVHTAFEGAKGEGAIGWMWKGALPPDVCCGTSSNVWVGLGVEGECHIQTARVASRQGSRERGGR